MRCRGHFESSIRHNQAGLSLRRAFTFCIAAACGAAGTWFAPARSCAQDIAPPRVGGYIQVRETWQETTNLTFSLNRVRLSVDGSLPHQFSYRFMAEFE